MSQLPMIKVMGPRPDYFGPESQTLSAPSRAADLIPFEPIDLMHFLSFRIALRRMAEKRQKGVFGRLYNRMAGKDPVYI